jgi:hypothetical protein
VTDRVVRTDHTGAGNDLVLLGDAGLARVDHHRHCDAATRAGGATMATSHATTPTVQTAGYQTVIGAGSLVVGPLIMAVGDLLHPDETWDMLGQAVIVVEQATRWYLAHLLLLVGGVLFVPGLLTLTDLAAARRPRVGYIARILLVIGLAGMSAVFVAEMMVGRFGSLGVVVTEQFLGTMFSGPIAGVLMPVTLSFFLGAAMLAASLIAGSGPLRWPAAVLLAGTLLVLAEIISGQVLLSQIGNLLAWGASAAFALLLVRGEADAPAGTGAGEALRVGTTAD